MHWPSSVDDLGLGGATFLMLIPYEIWTGERLGIELAVPKNSRTGRPVCMSPVPSGPGIEIWFRFLGRLTPCEVGGNHCQLRHSLKHWYSRVPSARKLPTWSFPPEGTAPLHFNNPACLEELEGRWVLEVRWISRWLEKLEAFGREFVKKHLQYISIFGV